MCLLVPMPVSENTGLHKSFTEPAFAAIRVCVLCVCVCVCVRPKFAHLVEVEDQIQLTHVAEVSIQHLSRTI